MEKLQIPATRIIQNSTEMFLFSMNSNQLSDLCTYDSRSASNPNGIQRSLQTGRAKKIAEYVGEASNISCSGIVTNLGPDVEVIEDDDVLNTVLLLFPDSHGDYMKVIDGQHRLEGLKLNDSVSFELPVIALNKVPREYAAKVFADLNSYQKPVSSVHLLELEDQMNSLKTVEKRALAIAHELNIDSDSPLIGKVKIRDDQNDCWVSNVQLKRLIEQHISHNGILAAKSQETATEIFKNYFKAVKETWIDIWEGDRNSYVLTWSIGFEIMLGIFGNIMRFCDLYENRSYSVESIKNQLNHLDDRNLEFPELGTFKLNWENETFKRLNSSTGRKDLIKQLNLKLAEIDEVRLAVPEALELDKVSSGEEEDSSGS